MRLEGERGSAALEFIAVGLILIVPLAYLVLALGVVQERLLGAQTAARTVARTVSAARDVEEAEARAGQALASVIAEYGLDEERTGIAMRCIPVDGEQAVTGGPCPTPGALLVVTVRTEAALPLVPPLFGLDRLARIPVEASAAYRVSRSWGTG